ncbi:alpha-ribazole phosphatase/probable phosphoglycerate mutase [Ectothiorhodospira mobilis]|uniref:Alpha-ribazole phosphatase/probable phosphoglycerate mutase n=1 Tax=Ectothiorhodospira mobilis TaxID=195064 RepID=A0A1I4QNS2_ECTMO|nr:histidine phosphatase family protein [Ectothiorhodospira mobilis]SFM41669.1 alpha-ribazole phosphatase/probable phosphoglycerate mutase [Ectothiorhodospira mobilis]
MSQVPRIDLMRHGQTTGGFAFRGSLDEPLTPEGWGQMQGSFDAHGPWDALIASPLQRCLAPARAWAGAAGLALQEEPRLREMHFGVWEGRTPADLMESEPEALARFWEDPLHHVPPGAEPLTAFRDRVLAAWGDLVRAPAPARRLVVTHGGVIRLILLHEQRRPLQDLLVLEVPHACLYRIHLHPGGHRVERLPVPTDPADPMESPQ